MSSYREYEYAGCHASDQYCYPNSNVLINKFNIKDHSLLHVTERQITALKLVELDTNPITGLFDLKHLQNIHGFLFRDIYEWAGKIRDGDFLIKDQSIFCRAMYIHEMATEIHNGLKKENYLKNLDKNDLIERLSFYMGEINALHPFREGNGRTQRYFFKQLCLNAGYDLDFRNVTKEALIKADIAGFNRDYQFLIAVLNDTISKC